MTWVKARLNINRLGKPEHDKPTGAAIAEHTLAGHIRRRLFIGFLITTLTTTLSLLIGLLAYFRIDQAYSETLRQGAFIQDVVVRFNNAVLLEILHTRAYLLTGNEQSLTSRDLSRRDFLDNYASLQSEVARLPSSATAALQVIKTLHDEYEVLAEEMIGLRRSGQSEATVDLFNERSDPLVFRLLAARQDMQSAIRMAALESNRLYSIHTGQLIFLVCVIFFAGFLANAWVIARLLALPLSTLDYLEQALIETAHSNTLTPFRLPRLISKPFSPVFQAYNSLITQLQETDASRLDFLAKLAHNLRSPMASIVGYAELMSAPNQQLPPGDLETFARSINKQARRMLGMVEQMVMAAYIGEDRLDLTLTPIRIGHLVTEIVDEARQRSQRDIILEDHLDMAVISCDVLHIRRAFWNLVDNALRFSEPDTPVRVTLRRSSALNGAEISIADQGIGIAEADLPTLFTRFGRIYNKLTRDVAGNGLGLYIAKHIIARHRGQITVRSRLGQGSTFVVTLPFRGGVA